MVHTHHMCWKNCVGILSLLLSFLLPSLPPSPCPSHPLLFFPKLFQHKQMQEQSTHIDAKNCRKRMVRTYFSLEIFSFISFSCQHYFVDSQRHWDTAADLDVYFWILLGTTRHVFKERQVSELLLESAGNKSQSEGSGKLFSSSYKDEHRLY